MQGGSDRIKVERVEGGRGIDYGEFCFLSATHATMTLCGGHHTYALLGTPRGKKSIKPPPRPPSNAPFQPLCDHFPTSNGPEKPILSRALPTKCPISLPFLLLPLPFFPYSPIFFIRLEQGLEICTVYKAIRKGPTVVTVGIQDRDT